MSSITDIVRGSLHTGIRLRLTQSASGYGGELQRAPDSGGSPGSWGLIVTLSAGDFGPNGALVDDALPRDGALWWYRWRHVAADQTPSSYVTTGTAGKAVALTEINRPSNL